MKLDNMRRPGDDSGVKEQDGPSGELFLICDVWWRVLHSEPCTCTRVGGCVRSLSNLDAIHDFFYAVHFCFLPLKHLASLPDDFRSFVSEQITPALWRQEMIMVIMSVYSEMFVEKERGEMMRGQGEEGNRN